MRAAKATGSPRKLMYHAVQQHSTGESQRSGSASLNLYLICAFPRSNNTAPTLVPCVGVRQS